MFMVIVKNNYSEEGYTSQEYHHIFPHGNEYQRAKDQFEKIMNTISEENRVVGMKRPHGVLSPSVELVEVSERVEPTLNGHSTATVIAEFNGYTMTRF